jgi:hypothetical protein
LRRGRPKTSRKGNRDEGYEGTCRELYRDLIDGWAPRNF